MDKKPNLFLQCFSENFSAENTMQYLKIYEHISLIPVSCPGRDKNGNSKNYITYKFPVTEAPQLGPKTLAEDDSLFIFTERFTQCMNELDKGTDKIHEIQQSRSYKDRATLVQRDWIETVRQAIKYEKDFLISFWDHFKRIESGGFGNRLEDFTLQSYYTQWDGFINFLHTRIIEIERELLSIYIHLNCTQNSETMGLKIKTWEGLRQDIIELNIQIFNAWTKMSSLIASSAFKKSTHFQQIWARDLQMRVHKKNEIIGQEGFLYFCLNQEGQLENTFYEKLWNKNRDRRIGLAWIKTLYRFLANWDLESKFLAASMNYNFETRDTFDSIYFDI